MKLEKSVENLLQERLTGKETHDLLETKVRTSVNKVIQKYFHSDENSQLDGEGYIKTEKETLQVINNQKDTINALIAKNVDDQLDVYVERAVKRVLRSNKVQNKLENLIYQIVEEQMQVILDERDWSTDQEKLTKQVENTIEKKSKALLRKIKIKIN